MRHDADRDRRVADRVAVGVDGERAVGVDVQLARRAGRAPRDGATWVPLKTRGSVARKPRLECSAMRTTSSRPSSRLASGAMCIPPP